MPSKEPTRWAVICPEHTTVYLTHEEYLEQVQRPFDGWECPWCSRDAVWDDDNYDAMDERQHEENF